VTVRIAAVGDIHAGPDSVGVLHEQLASLPDRADALFIAGDLTKTGAPEEARVLASEIQGTAVPVIAVLGNHDHHSDRADDVAAILRDVGVIVLEGDGVVVDTPGGSVGVAGVKGFGGGFAGASGSEFGEQEMKAFVRHTKDRADALHAALVALDADVRIALMHYSPVRETLQGEPPEIFPFLGSYLLAEAIDAAEGVDLALHGHAHRGREHGVTPGGVNVRNVAQTVIRQAYAVFEFERPAPPTRRRAVPFGAPVSSRPGPS
jgi:Icc-related predicted phosphoesterase